MYSLRHKLIVGIAREKGWENSGFASKKPPLFIVVVGYLDVVG
jgi:hypothetical protein